MTLQVRLGPDDEKSLILMKSKETAVIDIATVEDIEAVRLGDEVVEDPHVVSFSICDLDKRGDRDRRSVSLCNGRDSGPAQTATCKKMSWSPKTGSGGWGFKSPHSPLWELLDWPPSAESIPCSGY